MAPSNKEAEQQILRLPPAPALGARSPKICGTSPGMTSGKQDGVPGISTEPLGI
jgi:hypothetical protein